MSNLNLYEPWNLLNQFRREVDQMFTRANPTVGDSSIATSTWVPHVDIREDTDQFIIEADIPGVEPKDIEISMENGVLTIKGERKIEKYEEGKNYHRVERMHGTCYRRFSLPDTADAEKVTATGKHGVLQIYIAKKAVAQPRKISVQG